MEFPKDFIAEVAKVLPPKHYLNLHGYLRDGRDLEVFHEIDQALQAAEDELFPTYIIDCLKGVNGKTVDQLMAKASRVARIQKLFQDFDEIIHPGKYVVQAPVTGVSTRVADEVRDHYRREQRRQREAED